jgi:hypothetical protein
MKLNRNLIVCGAILCLMIASAPLFAQNPPPGNPSGASPIDGGVFSLVLGAVMYGYRMIKQNEVKEVKED